MCLCVKVQPGPIIRPDTFQTIMSGIGCWCSEAAGDGKRAAKDVAADAKDAGMDARRSVQQGVDDLQNGAEKASDKVGFRRVFF